jgi:hypothetical protein
MVSHAQEDVMKAWMVRLGSFVCAALIVAGAGGCSEEDTTCPTPPSSEPAAPLGVVNVTTLERAIEFWPYTGNSFAGTAVDPINLIFTGKANPVKIRAALLSLDGDRTAFGFPDAYPFNATWEDAIGGDVQTAYVGAEEGWVGSVVQLQLGAYDPIRVHLRLFRSDQSIGDTGGWTLGAAHFEVLITGTADHQVLSWELAEQVVVADLMRSGLLDATTPMETTGVIHDTPTFREIIPAIYNPLPVELKVLVDGPLEEVNEPVGIKTDGEATILHVAHQVPVVADVVWSTVTLTYNQVVPKPFCSAGPYDYLQINGPVAFTLSVNIGADGSYSYTGDYWGSLNAIPIDMSTGEPVMGEPYEAVVSGSQSGLITMEIARVRSEDHRLTQQTEGSEVLETRLVVMSDGEKEYAMSTRCLSDDQPRDKVSSAKARPFRLNQ